VKPAIPYADHIGLWANELRDWLPETIFDVHVHLSPPEVVGPISEARRKECAFDSFTWEDALSSYNNLFKGKEVAGLIAFPLPLREVNLEAANEYIVRLMHRLPKIKGFILAHPKDTKRTIAQFEAAFRAGARFSGVKPYYDLLGKSNYETTMPEFIPEELLEFMDGEGLIMMLHTSGIGVGDPENQRYLKSIASRFPRIKIILAHMGRYLKPEQFMDFMASDVMDCPNIFLETSYVTRTEIYQAVLKRKELWPRLLFGIDFPWGLTLTYERSAGEKPRPTTHNTYHVIKAIKDAIAGLHLDKAVAEQLKRAIFLENAESLRM
jgi:predicted TIM-barrel fold metal-dependent hydrolase